MEIRILTVRDIPAAMRLKNLAGWNQTEPDWRRLISLEPRGCFAAWLDGKLVATTTTTVYGRTLAWIGMVLVDPQYRRRGIATQLMITAMNYLGKAGVATVKLDATPAGQPVYEALGFICEGKIERWQMENQNDQDEGKIIRDVPLPGSVQRLDRLAFGADRKILLDLLSSGSCVPVQTIKTSGGQAKGYALARPGANAVYIGPLIARDQATAQILLDRMLAQSGGKMVFLDYHTEFKAPEGTLRERGFVQQRAFIRMRYGVPCHSQYIFAIAGPEFG